MKNGILKKKELVFDIVIKGAYGSGNFGDDALLDTILRLLPSDNYKIGVISKPSKYIYNNYPHVTIIDSVKPHIIKTTIFIYGGGTQFFSFHDSTSKLNKIFYHFKNPRYLINKLFYGATDIIFDYNLALGLGLGPFYNNDISKFRSILEEIDFFVLRDNKSIEYARDNGFNNVVKSTDICFTKNISLADSEIKSRVDDYRVAIILRDWTRDKKGCNHFSSMKKLLISEPNKYKLILFGNDKYWLDFATSNALDFIQWNPEINKIDDFIKELSLYDYIITSRFHGVIYSTLLGIPAISIEIEPKLSIVSNLNSGLLFKNDMGLDDITSLCSELEDNFIFYRDRVIKSKHKNQNEATVNKEVLVEKVNLYCSR